MTLSPFDRKSLMAVGEALEIAEERTADYYKFSSMHWRGHRYDVKTLSALKREQIIPDPRSPQEGQGARAFASFGLCFYPRACAHCKILQFFPEIRSFGQRQGKRGSPCAQDHL